MNGNNNINNNNISNSTGNATFENFFPRIPIRLTSKNTNDYHTQALEEFINLLTSNKIKQLNYKCKQSNFITLFNKIFRASRIKTQRQL